MDITATGPDIWLGKIGYFLILLAFISALLSAFFYWTGFGSKKPNAASWLRTGRQLFFLHGLAVIGVVVTLFYLMATKKYTFAYVYQHASNDLPFQYLFAAFWEGQQGSTLLWAFWHVVLGYVAIFKTRKWEGSVVGTVALVQVFLLSMVLGIYFFGHKVGDNPFALLKSTMGNAPIFLMNANFVPQDGKGLNELLRNYWMVIHPPTVFLGFASITIPFGFALGALKTRLLKEWITPALPWTLFAAAFLGIGVLMGGAWAYESLSFGGFWTWDPVENASLVPWLIIVAGLHLMLIFRSTGYSGLAAFVFVILSFLFVAYSSFLTKSGVLGESSVHSFADIGMSGQLLLFVLFFWILAFTLLQPNRKQRINFLLAMLVPILLERFHLGAALGALLVISLGSLFFIKDFPKKDKEEEFLSREFWMFIGALALLLSALHITVVTSFPVFNKLFNKDWLIENAEEHYNLIQIWPAVVIAFASGAIQYFAYGRATPKSRLSKLLFPLVIAAALTILFVVVYKFNHPIHILLMLAACYAIVANLDYLFSILKGKIKIGGASIAHLGFGLLMLGVVISQSKKKIMSLNNTGLVYSSEADTDFNENNVLLYEGEPQKMGPYKVTLQGDREGRLRDRVVVDFEKFNGKEATGEQFTLLPAFKKMDTSIVADPAIKRTLLKDLYTHISLLNLGTDIDTTAFTGLDLKVADSTAFDRMIFTLKDLTPLEQNQKPEGADIAVKAAVDVITKDTIYSVEPIYQLVGNTVVSEHVTIVEEKLDLRFDKISPEDGLMTISVRSGKPFKKYILLKAMIFPLINLVWLGSILMFVGFLISMFDRARQKGKH